MLRRQFALIIAFIVVVAALVYAAGQEIGGAHLESGLVCFDCHETDEPVKRANQRLCMDCHGDMTDRTELIEISDAQGHTTESSIHTSHAGQMRCTLCHAVHKPSTLYCNEGCHHTWQIKVP